MELSPQQVQAEIAKYKVKEGHLFKRYGFFGNEWKERWIVLTENYLMSFQFKNNYSKPCQLLSIEDIETLKSYFKKQQERDLSFRVECKKENFYLAARTNQDKWAWIGAIERVIDKKQTKVFNPKAQVYDPLRDKIDQNASLEEFYEKSLKNMKRGSRMGKSRESRTKEEDLGEKGEQGKKGVERDEKGDEKKEVLRGQIQLIQQISEVTQSSQTKQEPKPQTDSKHIPQSNQSNTQIQSLTNNSSSSTTQTTQLSPQLNKESQKQSQNQLQKVDPKDQKSQNITSRYQAKDSIINRLFQDIMSHQRDMRFFVDFIANLALDQNLQYTDSVVQACINHPKARYFIESVVKVFTQETEEHPINVQLLFMILIHEYYGNYFYKTDLQVLVDNLMRGLELYKSQLNHYYILQLIEALITTDNWPTVPEPQKKELKQLINQIQKTSPSPTNQNISKSIILCL